MIFFSGDEILKIQLIIFIQTIISALTSFELALRRKSGQCWKNEKSSILPISPDFLESISELRKFLAQSLAGSQQARLYWTLSTSGENSIGEQCDCRTVWLSIIANHCKLANYVRVCSMRRNGWRPHSSSMAQCSVLRLDCNLAGDSQALTRSLY